MLRQTYANNLTQGGCWRIYFASVCAWMVISTFIVPEAPGGDIFILKDPGVNLAFGHGYVSCAVPDNPSLNFKLHASYPPVYPLLYAGYVSICGFGVKQNVYFELACRALRNASLLFIAFLITESSRARKIFLLFCCLTIPISIGISDRPEDLSLAFMLLSLGLVHSANKIKSVVLASLINVITCLTHPFGGVTAIITGSVLLLNRLHQRPELNRMQWLGAWILPPCLLITSAWTTLWIIAPGLIQRFLFHSTQMGGISYVATSEGRGHWTESFLNALTTNHLILFKTIALVWVVILNLIFFWKFGNRKTLVLFLFVILWFLTPLFIFLRSFEYRPYAAIAVTAFTALWLFSSAQKREAVILFYLGLTIVFLSIMPAFAKQFIGRCLLTGSSDFDPAQIHRFIPEDPGGKFFVAVNPHDYFELKITNKIFDSHYSSLDKSVKYFLIIDDPGLLASIHQEKPIYPAGYVPEEWEVIHRPDMKMGKLLRYFVAAPLLRASAESVYMRKSP
jgi:hypothetical protein